MEEEQKLGMLQLCIPADGCKKWLVKLSIEDILAEYPVVQPEIQPERKPMWKKQEQEEEGTA